MVFREPRKPLILRPSREIKLDHEQESELAMQEHASDAAKEILRREAVAFIFDYLKKEVEPAWTKKMNKDVDAKRIARERFFDARPELVNQLYKEVWKEFFRRKIKAGVPLGSLFERKPHTEKHGHPSELPKHWGKAKEDDLEVLKYVHLYAEVKNAILARFPDPNQTDYEYRETIAGLHLAAENEIREELRSGQLKVPEAA